jgi:formylglycine-generating enzyme required for sulfatase activity
MSGPTQPALDPCEPDLVLVAEHTVAERIELQRAAAEAAGLPVVFQDALADGAPGPDMVIVPAGMFAMGSPRSEFGHAAEEGPQCYVCIRRAFAIGRYTVTAQEFERFRRDTGWVLRRDLIWSRGQHPVINIRYADAQAYARWLSAQTDHAYRLPSEAEWEHAARAGTSGPFCFGDSVSCREVHFNAAFPYEEARRRRRWIWPRCLPMAGTLPVGSLPPSPWGLHEVHGNVWELTASPWTASHLNTDRDGRVDPRAGGRYVVTKGGSWFDPAVLARSAARRPRLRDELDVNLGVRLVRELR